MSKKTTLVCFIALALLTILLRLPTLTLVLDTDSSVNAFFARQLMRGETLYDKFHTAHHLPAAYYTFVLAFQLFGDNPAAPKLLLIPVTLAAAWLIFFVGRSYFNDLTGILGAFLFVLGTSQFYLAGTTAEMEHFANLFMIASVFLFLALLKQKSAPAQFIWVGVLGAVSILYKILFIAPLTAIGVGLFYSAWMERAQVGNIKKLLLRLTAIGAGVIIPLAGVVLYYAHLGLLQRFLLVFTLGFKYANDPSLIILFPKPFGFPLFMLAMNNIVLLVISLIGTYRLSRRVIQQHGSENPNDLILVSWLIFSLILAGFRGGGYQHYVLIVIPPLALTAAYEIAYSYQSWQKTSSQKLARFGAGILTALIVLFFLGRNFELYRYYFPSLPNQENTPQHRQAGQIEVFDYIRAHTTYEDFIYVWSIDLQAYYYADRLPPIDILWPSYVSATGPPKRIFNPRTKYIVMSDAATFARPAWLLKGIEENYFLETTLNGMELYRRVDP
ncbi:hypothetical protein MASR2M66_19210 [Chloroflexota bacterium]